MNKNLTFTTIKDDSDDIVLKAIEFIKDLETARKRDPLDVFAKGNCGNMFYYLRQLLGNSVHAYIIDEHVYCERNGRFYDVRGRIENCPYECDEILAEHSENNLGIYTNNYNYNKHHNKGGVPEGARSEFEYDRENREAIDAYLDSQDEKGLAPFEEAVIPAE